MPDAPASGKPVGELIMNQNGINQRQQENVSFFMRSLEGLAKAIGLIVAFLVTPPFYGVTVGWVQNYMAYHYGRGIEGLAGLVWFFLIAFFTYHFSKATIGTALLFGGLGIAMRLLLA
jgi:hypothetical protein